MSCSATEKDNPIVFLEISIDGCVAGRVIIELRKDVVPKTAENFRALCTGEKGIGQFGKPLCFKGSSFFRAVTLFMVQGGDIVNDNGTCGESIYGKKFEDENFLLSHEEGVVSMANEGKPDTNSSQFFICTVPCIHLNGINVAFGQVLSGLGLMMEIDKLAQNEKNIPIVNCTISDCGELGPREDWGINDNDGTPDTLPPYPEDWIFDYEIKEIDIKDKVTLIRLSGNTHFTKGNYKVASRKYQKAIRYVDWLLNILDKKKDSTKDISKEEVERLKHGLSLNLAAVKLKLSDFVDVVYLCNEVLKSDPDNVKGLFRRGLARMALQEYSKGLDDLQKAQSLSPDDKNIRMEIIKAMKLNSIYKKKETNMFRKMFA